MTNTNAKKGTITVAAIQTHYGEDMADNIARTIAYIEEAAGKGAQVIVPSELFQGPYFCTTQDERWFDTAYPAAEHPCVIALQPVARKLGVVIPVSIFERDGPQTYNSVVMLDHEGDIMGIYRKSHIPDGPGYQENTISGPATPVSRCGKPFTGISALASAGTSGFPKPRANWS